VRDMDILPDELTAYIQAFKAQSSGAVIPTTAPAKVDTQKNDTEETNEEKE